MYKYIAKVVRWVDWDTVILDIDVGFHCRRTERIRLARIDAWNIRDKSSYVRRYAKSARHKAKTLCPEWSDVRIETRKNPKRDIYARYIVEIYINDLNVNDELLKHKGVDKAYYW